MPRLLVLCDQIYPSDRGEFSRLAGFLRLLPDFGWQPEVLCLWNDTSRNRIGHRSIPVHEALPLHWMWQFTVGRLFSMKQVNGSASEWGPIDNGRATSPWMMKASKRTGIPFLRNKALRLLRSNGFDALLSFGEQGGVHRVAAELAQQGNLPWVADLSRSAGWFDIPRGRQSDLPSRFRMMEKNRVFHADRLVVHTQEYRRFLLQYRPAYPRARVQVIPDGCEIATPSVDDASRTGSRFRILLDQQDMTFVGLKAFLSALGQLLSKHPGWVPEFEVIFSGYQPADFHVLLQRLNLAPCFQLARRDGPSTNHPQVSQIDTITILQEETLSSRLDNARLFRWLPLGRPILAIGPEGALRRCVREWNLGRDFSPQEIAGIAATLTYWFVEFKNQTLPRNRKALPQWNPFELTRKLAEVLTFCLRRRQSV